MITNNLDIANTMNTFFVNVGASIESKIPPSNKAFSEFLNAQNPVSLFLLECTEDEVYDIIKKFSTSKACGPFSIPSKILKEFAPYFLLPITNISKVRMKCIFKWQIIDNHIQAGSFF